MKVKNILISIAIILLVILIEFLAYGYYLKTEEVIQNPIVTMEIEEFGTVQIELYPDKAPNTVANFIKLVNDGYYNGLTFHRVLPDILIQGGDINGDGSGSTDFTIPGEFIANGYKENNLRHEAGTISMARSDYSQFSSALLEQSFNSAGAQFFITLTNTAEFDGSYAAFGKVISGLDIIEEISNLEVVTTESGETGKNKPKNPPVIKSMTVNTFGVDYGEPTRLEPFDFNEWYSSLYGGSFETVVE